MLKRFLGLLVPTLTASSAIAMAARLLREARKLPLKGRVVVITGGARGLGLVLAQEFARHGARLALLDRESHILDHAAQQLRAKGSEVLTLFCDVQNQDAVNGSIDRITQHYGKIDVLVNNAGVIQVGPLEHMHTADFENALAVHFWGPLYTSLRTIPHMRRQGGGRIVNISSIGGKVATPHLLPYCASKFALVGLSDGLRAELARDNIRVTTVCPGLMRTGSHRNALFKGRHRAEFTWFALASSLPFFSTSARNAARQIVAACRRGDAQLTITPQANLLILAQTLFPEIVAVAMEITNRLLPGPTGASGDKIESGWQNQSRWAPSLLTILGDRAAERYNGNPERLAPASSASTKR